ARAVSETEKWETTNETVVSSVVLAELVSYIEGTIDDKISAPFFKLSDLVKLYTQRMEQHGIKLNQRVHSIRLKERILAQFPNMQEHNKGCDILLAFEDDIGDALAKACDYDHDNDAVHLLRAAQIVRRDMSTEGQGFTGSFSDKCQENSVSTLLMTLVSMILKGPSIDSPRQLTTAFLSLASTPSELPDGVLSTLERFIVLLYDRRNTCCDVNVLRKKLFSRKSRSLEHLPPTRAALEQHIKRAAYQAGHIWGQDAIAFVNLPSPCDWGWMKSGDELEPLWTTLSEVSTKSCHELISCGCRKH
ncbi:hypothetical protein Hamer_G028174, partial [Homarus americanus]